MPFQPLWLEQAGSGSGYINEACTYIRRVMPPCSGPMRRGTRTSKRAVWAQYVYLRKAQTLPLMTLITLIYTDQESSIRTI